MGSASLGFEPEWHTVNPAARRERCPSCGIRVERRVRRGARMPRQHVHHEGPALATAFCHPNTNFRLLQPLQVTGVKLDVTGNSSRLFEISARPCVSPSARRRAPAPAARQG